MALIFFIDLEANWLGGFSVVEIYSTWFLIYIWPLLILIIDIYDDIIRIDSSSIVGLTTDSHISTHTCRSSLPWIKMRGVWDRYRFQILSFLLFFLSSSMFLNLQFFLWSLLLFFLLLNTGRYVRYYLWELTWSGVSQLTELHWKSVSTSKTSQGVIEALIARWELIRESEFWVAISLNRLESPLGFFHTTWSSTRSDRFVFFCCCLFDQFSLDVILQNFLATLCNVFKWWHELFFVLFRAQNIRLLHTDLRLWKHHFFIKSHLFVTPH